MRHQGVRSAFSRVCLFGGLVLLLGCEGVIGGEGGDPRIGGAPDGDSGSPGRTQSFICQTPGEIVLGTSPIRRLTNVEYRNTVRDLFGGNLPSLPEQPTDAVLKGSFENDATSLAPSDVRIARYESAAFALGEHAVADPTARARVIPCSTSDQACGRQFVEEFGRRVFRRPLRTDESARWGAYFETQRNEIDFDGAVQLTVTAMLQTPLFLYRMESGTDAVGDRQLDLAPHELASRLSYFLWESMPDDELLAAADANELATDEQIAAQTRRMLDDPRAREAVRNFARQWLYLDRVLDESKVPEMFPLWGSQAQQSAREESLRFVENTVFDGGTVSDLMTSNVAYVDDITAELYGVQAPAAPWGQVQLDPNERAGILSRIAFLAGNAHDANGSPPLRGVYVMERILCEARPSPPANADLSVPEADPNQGPMTNRELFEERTSPGSCQGCHVRIDGFGFGFEAYDAAGIYQDEDSGLPVDATGFANGIGNDDAFDGPVELQELLAQSDVVHGCVAKQWLRYAYGRNLEQADACQIEQLQATLMENGGNLIELLVDIVLRPEFRLRAEIGE